MQTGFAFIMLVLKEMKGINNGQLLINSMEHLYKVLKDVSKGALIQDNDTRMNMAFDVNLNEARTFLLEVINDKTNSERMVQLAHKIILLIGVARSSVEDLLVLCSTLQSSKNPVDLRPELRRLRSFDPSSSAQVQQDSFSPGELKEIKTSIYRTLLN